MSRVLLLESDPTVAKTLVKLLAALGHEVTLRTTCHEAALVAFLEPLEAVFSSASFAEHELTELHEIARRRSPRVQAVVHGAQVVDGDRDLWSATGANRVTSTFALVEGLLDRLGVCTGRAGRSGRSAAAMH